MHALSLQRVSFSYTSAQTIFEELSLDLYAGWTGLIGANGTGKSTLLRLLSGELKPDAGSIKYTPKEARIILCEQSIEVFSQDVVGFATSQDKESYQLRGALRLKEETLARWPTLSPGERKRWQIGAALYQAPDILLLDEPTNHLDQEGRALLRDALLLFQGLGIIVSHDREILEKLTYQTMRCTPCEVELYSGSYEQARSLWEAEHQRKKDDYNQAKQEEEKRQEILAERREILRSVDRKRSSKNRMKNIKDHDARGGLMKFKINTAAARIARQVGVANERAERASSVKSDLQWQREVGRSLFVSYEAPPNQWITTLQVPSLMAGDTLLLGGVSVAARRGEKIYIKGPNGAGKTTLLNALYKASPLRQAQGNALQKEKLFYLPQELLEEEQLQLLQKTKQLAPKERGQVLSLLAALGVEPERVLSSKKPSHGEARKLALAYGLGTCSWALFLDEPTNHLDLPSIERLEDALSAFPGAMILISHDETFAKKCTQHQWELRGKSLLIG